MAINIREVLASDSLSQLTDKLNYNFDQILLNGGGPQGQQGPQGVQGVLGPQGIQGTIWFTGSGDPNTLTFSTEARLNDYYLEDDGTVWKYSSSTYPNWTETSVNMKGPQGEDGQVRFNSGGFNVYSGSSPYDGEDFLYIPSDLELYNLAATDIKSVLIGGYPDGAPITLPNSNPISTSYANSISSASTGILFLHTYNDSTPQLKFSSGNGSVNPDYMPSMFTDQYDNLTLYNPRIVSDLITGGLNFLTADSDINLTSNRDITISSTGAPLTPKYSGIDTTIGNISIISKDIDTTYVDANSLLLQNNYYNVSGTHKAYGKIELTGASKGGTRYILLETANVDKSDYNRFYIGSSTNNNFKFYTQTGAIEFELSGYDTLGLWDEYGKFGFGPSSLGTVDTWLGYANSNVNANNRVLHIKDTVDVSGASTIETGFMVDKTFTASPISGGLSGNKRGGAWMKTLVSPSDQYNAQFYGLFLETEKSGGSSGNNVGTLGGIHSKIYSNLTASTTTYIYGFKSEIENNLGTTTNAYHIYLDEMEGGVSITNKYGIYQEGTDELNYFGGKVGIGESATEMLTVGGAIKIGDTVGNVSGIIKYTGSDFLGRTGTGWVSLTNTGGASNVSVANQNNNYLITCTSVEDSLNAEANLTYDGTTFTVNESNSVIDGGNFTVNDDDFVIKRDSGYIGINVSNPSEYLHMDGNILFKTSSDRSITVEEIETDTDGRDLTIHSGKAGGDNRTGGDLIMDAGEGKDPSFYGNILIGTNYAQDIILGGVSKYSRVGIGTSTPQQYLHVDDVMRLQPYVGSITARTDVVAGRGDIYIHYNNQPESPGYQNTYLAIHDGTNWRFVPINEWGLNPNF